MTGPNTAGSHNLVARCTMLGPANPAKKLPVMIRSISLVVVALLGALWGGAARAQMSQADLLTRIDRLEAALRELTGTVEQLQYRNQQLEQQLRALQDASQTGVRPPASPRPLRPGGAGSGSIGAGGGAVAMTGAGGATAGGGEYCAFGRGGACGGDDCG